MMIPAAGIGVIVFIVGLMKSSKTMMFVGVLLVLPLIAAYLIGPGGGAVALGVLTEEEVWQLLDPVPGHEDSFYYNAPWR